MRNIRLTALLRLIALAILFSALGLQAQNDPLPAWKDSAAKQAIINFVRTTTDASSSNFVSPEQRFATFDQDGTTWVEHPMYTQMVFAFDRVRDLAPDHPEWKTIEPFKSVIADDTAAMSRFTTKDFETIFVATHTGMSVEAFQRMATDWLGTATDPRWHRHYTELVYEPMLEVMKYLRANGYRTYIVTGGGQDFVRVYSEAVYGIAPEQIIGSAVATEFTYKGHSGILMRPPRVLLNDNFSGKPEDIHLFIGRHPHAAFGNSTGDQQMLEYTQAGPGAHLMMIVLHDDPEREYAYGPATGLPPSNIGTFTQALYDEAKSNGWFVISMKHDWKRVFAWEK